MNNKSWKNNKYLLPRHFQPQLMKNAVEYYNFLFEYSRAQHSTAEHSTAQCTLKTHLNNITVEFK